MTFQLIPLPYDAEALAPAISARTLSFHHGKHHRAYIDKTNALADKAGLAGRSLEEVIAAARGKNRGLFNNAAQSWNHGFYWHSLSPEPGAPSAELQRAITDSFGSLEALKTALKERGAAHFASGWVWLVADGGGLAVAETHDGDTLADAQVKPLLVIDLWEHAYYLDHQNRRPEYLEQVVETRLNWRFASENFARDGRWTWPA